MIISKSNQFPVPNKYIGMYVSNCMLFCLFVSFGDMILLIQPELAPNSPSSCSHSGAAEVQTDSLSHVLHSVPDAQSCPYQHHLDMMVWDLGVTSDLSIFLFRILHGNTLFLIKPRILDLI